MSRLKVSPDQTSLILRGADAKRADGAFPRSEWQGKELHIPWTLENSIRLTAMELPSVSPIVRDYNFGAYRLEDMPHQVKMADFLVRNRRGYIFGETGTGKTLGSLWGLDYLIGLGEVKRVLVLCPLSIVNETWGDTLKVHFPHLSYSVIVGTKDKRQRLLKTKHQFHILNFDGVFSLLDDLLANPYDFVLIDESTAVKTVTTRRWKSINKVVPATARLILQTGTPIPQGPMDAYGQAKLMGNRKIPHTVARFRDEMMYRVTDFKWVPRSDSMEKVKKILTPALYVAKRDVLKDLPPVTYTYRQVEMSKAQKSLFEELRKRQQAEVEGTQITAVNAAVKMAKLLQVAGGAVYNDDGDVIACDAKARIAEMLDLIEQSLSKTIVFVPYRHVLEQIGQALTKHKIKYREIHGDVKRSDREQVFKEFQQEDTFDVLLAIPNAMAHGVTATAASTIVWFMPTSRNEIYNQACARIDRKGQTLPMTICHLTAHPIEKQLYQAQQETIDYERKVLALYNRLLKGGLKDE